MFAVRKIVIKPTIMASSRATRTSSRKPNPVSKVTQSANPVSGDLVPEFNAAVSKAASDDSKMKRKSATNSTSTASTKKVRLCTPELYESKDKKADEKTTLERPAEPHRTAAPLVTPRGSRIVAYRADDVDKSPSKTGLPRPTATTGTILDLACAHLIKMDHTGKLESLIAKHYCKVFCPEGLAEECEPFKALCSSIIAQQVSGAAASSIKKKFIGLFCETLLEGATAEDLVFPTPAQVAVCEVPFLRTAGLSQRKAEYIKGLAEKFACGELNPAMLVNATDEEVLEKLIAVRGLGKWSVEMFATFSLKRMDILSTGDLGVQRGMASYLGKDVSKLKAKGGGKWKYLSEQDMLQHSEKFAPYR